MNTFDNLFSRKSIRTYNGENITESELELILKSAYASNERLAEIDEKLVYKRCIVEIYMAKYDQNHGKAA